MRRMENDRGQLTHDDCVVCTRLELFQGLEPVLCSAIGEAGSFHTHFDELFALEEARNRG